MGQRVLRGGIVGCGVIANRSHIPVWQRMREVEIVAACDVNEIAAETTANRFAIPNFYTDLHSMLSRENLDFIDICTPPLTHFQLSSQAMDANLHVLVEKPMATRLYQADAMVEECGKHAVKLCVVHNLLFTPVVQEALSLVKASAIGEFLGVEVELLDRGELLGRQDHWCHHLPGGILNEYCAHPIYLAMAFLGNIHSIKSIATKHSRFPWVTFDELKVLMEAERGLGSFHVSCNSPRNSFTLKVFGTQAQLHIDNCALTVTRSAYRGVSIQGILLDQLNLSLQAIGGTVSSSLKALAGHRYYRIGHQHNIQMFVESIKKGVAAPVPGEVGRETIGVLDEVWKQIGLL